RRIREEEPPRPSTRLLKDEGRRMKEEPKSSGRSGFWPYSSFILHPSSFQELDWIVMKALEKEPSRRYETADNLARDLVRYLEGDPVEAGPPSASYRLSKALRKHRALLATATAFVILLVAAAAVSTWQAGRATRAEVVARDNLTRAEDQQARAERSASEAEAVLNFFRDKVISAARPPGQDGGLGREVKLRDALKHAEASIPKSLADQPRV